MVTATQIRTADSGSQARRALALLALLICSFAQPVLGAGAVAAEAGGDTSEFEIEDDPLFDDDMAEDEYDPLFDDEFEDTPVGFPDPFETPNRGILHFNQFIDTWLLDPVTIVYRFVLPEPVRRSVRFFFDNLNSTQILVNDGLQLEWKDTGITTFRFLINSTVGIGGLFDPAAYWGIEGHYSDFGQTLAIAGAPSGPYLLLPLLGPTTIRDGIGLGVDTLLHPTFYLLGGTDILLFTGTEGLTERARHYEELKALEESSIDFYAAMRSGFYQNRQSQIWSRRQDRRPPGDR
jgi:phospholipid-binding lipoprotein MlaA